MKLRWLPSSRRDLIRLHDFLKNVNPRAAGQRFRAIITSAEKLPDSPHIGKRVEAYEPREVRATIIMEYEIHYEIMEDAVVILRIWHQREER